MRHYFFALTIAGVALSISTSRAADPVTDPGSPPVVETQPGVGERVGESVDRGLTRLGEKLRRGWADIRKSVDELTVQGRVYGRLRWDKALANAPVEITVQNESVVTLTGSVPDAIAQRAAISLAENTIGVSKVVDRLTVSPANIPPTVTIPPINSTPATRSPQ